MNITIEIGTVFKVDKTYWKVIGSPRNTAMGLKHTYESYQVIKCNKNGKEFRDTNGFNRQYVENHAEIIGVFPREKANIDDGVEAGIKKRRIQYLKDCIEAFSKELKELEG